MTVKTTYKTIEIEAETAVEFFGWNEGDGLVPSYVVSGGKDFSMCWRLTTPYGIVFARTREDGMILAQELIEKHIERN